MNRVAAGAGDDVGSSRMRWAVMTPSRTPPGLIGGHWQILVAMGAMPRQQVRDNEGAVGGWRRGTPILSAEFESSSAAALGPGCICAGRDPEAKGLTEHNNRCAGSYSVRDAGFDGR